MRSAFGAAALTLFSQAYIAVAQDCPTGYNRTVIWRSCPTNDEPTLQCAILQVPLDYSDPASSASMNIPLVRVQATVTNPAGEQSIIYNPGGPGGSGIGAFAEGTGSYLQKKFGAQYNWISFDPRGIGLSTPFANGQQNYQCPSNGFRQGPFETDDQILTAVVNYSGQGQTCAQNPQGPDGQYMGTTFVARDIVAISQALAGEDGYVRYYGASYGTLLGSTLAAMFPKRMERVVLDGNINPTDYYYGLGDEAAAEIDDAVANFFRECVAAGPDYCALANGKTAEALQAEYDSYLASIKTPSDNYIDWYDTRTEFENILKNPSKFPGYSQKLAGYYRNNSTNTTITRRQTADFDPNQASAAADAQPLSLYGVTCNDFEGPRVVNEATFKRYRDIYKARSSYAGDGGLLWILYMCSAWQTKAKEQLSAPLTGVDTRNPVLFVNTIYDPVTPLISAENSSAGFVGSGVLISNGAGHCSNAEPNPALDAAMAGYFSTGVIPAQRQFNKTTNSFKQGEPIGTDADDITGDMSGGNSLKKLKRAAYPRELLKMLNDHAEMKRQAGLTIPPGCTAIGSNGTVTTTSRSSTSTSMSSTSGSTSSKSGSGYGSSWGQWQSSTKTTSTTPSWSTWLSGKSSVTTSSKSQSWGTWSGAVPTTTVYVTGIVDVCPTGLATKTVTLTATCSNGCYEKPTGVPEGYTTTKVWCEACATKGYVEVTSAVPVTTWAAWSGNFGGNYDKPSSTWVDWQANGNNQPAVSSWVGWQGNGNTKPATSTAVSTWAQWNNGNGGKPDNNGNADNWGAWNGNGNNDESNTWVEWNKPATDSAANTWAEWNAGNGNNKPATSTAVNNWGEWQGNANVPSGNGADSWNAWNGVSTASSAQSSNGVWNNWGGNGQASNSQGASSSWNNWASSATPSKTQSSSASWGNWAGNGPAPTSSSTAWNEWEGKGAASTSAKGSDSAWDQWAGSATPTNAQGSSTAWNEWAAGTGLVQAYKGAAGKATVGVAGIVFVMAAVLLL